MLRDTPTARKETLLAQLSLPSEATGNTMKAIYPAATVTLLLGSATPALAQDANDYVTDPGANADDRIVCGVIESAS